MHDTSGEIILKTCGSDNRLMYFQGVKAGALMCRADDMEQTATGLNVYRCPWIVREIGRNIEFVDAEFCKRFIDYHHITADISGTLFEDGKVYTRGRVIAEIQTILSVLKLERERSLSDVVELHRLPKHLFDMVVNQCVLTKSRTRFDLVTATDVVEQRQEFVIKPYLPVGKITILQAEPGVGKTFLACGIAAAVSRGGSFMEKYPISGGNVLLFTTEDDNSVIKSRLKAAGADLNKCYIPENNDVMTFQDPRIESAIEDNNIKLVIFDPLQAFIGSRVDMFRANETRPILASLAAMAERHKCAVLIVCHTAKDTKGKSSIYRSLGSADIPAAARSIIQVYPAPDAKHVDGTKECLAIQIKASSTALGKSIRYRISGEYPNIKFEFVELTDDTEASYQKTLAAASAEDDSSAELYELIKKIFKSNITGFSASWKDLQTLAAEDGTYIPEDSYALCSQIRKLQPLFQARDFMQVNFHLSQSTKPIKFNGKQFAPQRGRGVIVYRSRETYESNQRMDDGEVEA